MSRTTLPEHGLCARTLSAAYQDAREITMVFGVMRDKAVQEMTEILFPIASQLVVTQANNPRAATPDEIRQRQRV